jgi:hypothetical protein
MKKEVKYLAGGLAAFTLALLTSTFSVGIGKNQDETAYYNAPAVLQNEQKETSERQTIDLYENTKVVFAGVDEAKEILEARDKYTNSQTSFDRRVRLNSEKPVSEEEYLDFAGEQVLSWNESEKVRIEVILNNLVYRLKDYDLNLPPRVLLIKTTGREEGGASYCRDNAIILPQNILNRQGGNLETLITHELFHIFTKNNLKTRDALYALINFKKCEKAVLPQKLLDIEITTPDVPVERYYVEVEHEGENIDVIPMITLSDFDPAKNRPFFRYLKLELVEVKKTDDECRYVRNEQGEPVVFNVQELTDYLQKVGENTSYLIHPEEILADDFAIMVLGKQPVKSKWVIEKMQALLENKKPRGVGIN